jgi:lysophospholipase L1-like esterase
MVLTLPGGIAMRCNKSVHIGSASVLLMVLSVLFSLFIGEIAIRYVHGAWPFDKELINVQNLPPDEMNMRWHFYPKSKIEAYDLSDEADTGCRVLLLGDSVTAGLNMDVIESHLARERDGSSTPVSLIKMGNGGHTTYQELEFLRVIGLELHPRLVVLGIVLNDVYYKYLHRPTESRFLDAEPAARLNRFDTNDFPGAMFARSHLAHDLVFGAQLLWKQLNGHPEFYFERRVDAHLAWKAYGWEKTGELLGEMQQLVEGSGAELDAIIFPTIYQSNEGYRQLDEEYIMYPIEAAKQILEQREIPYLDLSEAVYAQGGVELFKDWVHFNVEGNLIVAKEIANFLNRRLDLGVCERPAPADEALARGE